jgi:Tol biopolymer transport system component
LEDGRKTLVDNRTTITRLKWLPDGSALAYLVPSHAGQGFRKDLIVHRLDGSSPLYLHSHTDHTGYGTQFGMQIGAIDFAFTPDLSAVYFSGIYSGGSSSYIYRIRGYNWSQLPVRVTDSFEGGVDSLSWSPDGTQMSAVICEEGNIYLYEPEVKELTKVSDFPAGQTGGVCLMTLEWFPDSQGIAFFRNGSIYRINKDGTNLKQLTGAVSSGFYQYPTISPDGKLIAYSASTTNGKEIFLMDLNGENVFKLSDGDSAAWQPGTP